MAQDPVRPSPRSQASCWVLTGQKGEGAPWGLFYKNPNPFDEGSTLMT